MGNICIVLFVNQVVTSEILSWTLFFRFFCLRKKQDKNLNISRTKRAFKMKWRAYLIIFKGLLFQWGKKSENLTLVYPEYNFSGFYCHGVYAYFLSENPLTSVNVVFNNTLFLFFEKFFVVFNGTVSQFNYCLLTMMFCSRNQIIWSTKLVDGLWD